MVDAALADPRQAGLRPSVVAALELAGVLATDPESVGPTHVRPLLELGFTETEVEAVITICVAFATINRIADALEFDVPARPVLERAARVLYKRGYVIP